MGARLPTLLFPAGEVAKKRGLVDRRRFFVQGVVGAQSIPATVEFDERSFASGEGRVWETGIVVHVKSRQRKPELPEGILDKGIEVGGQERLHSQPVRRQRQHPVGYIRRAVPGDVQKEGVNNSFVGRTEDAYRGMSASLFQAQVGEQVQCTLPGTPRALEQFLDARLPPGANPTAPSGAIGTRQGWSSRRPSSERRGEHLRKRWPLELLGVPWSAVVQVHCEAVAQIR